MKAKFPIMNAIEGHYRTLCKYLNWKEGGYLLCYELGTRQDAENSKYKEIARENGLVRLQENNQV